MTAEKTATQKNELPAKENWSQPQITIIDINQETLVPLKVNSGNDFQVAS